MICLRGGWGYDLRHEWHSDARAAGQRDPRGVGVEAMTRLRFQSLSLTARESIRGIRRAPVLSSSIVVSIALAVALNTAMVGLVRELMLDAPPGLASPGSLRILEFRRSYSQGETEVSESATFGHYLAIREALGATDEVAAYRCGSQPVTVQLRRRSATVCGASSDLFHVFRGRPAIGRWPVISDESGEEAAISYSAWRTLFGGDRSVLGSTLSVGDRQLFIVGVAPEGFRGVEDLEPDVWAPLDVVGGGVLGTGWRSDFRNAWLSLVLRVHDVPAHVVEEHIAARLRGLELPGGALHESVALRPIQRGLRSRGHSNAVIVLWLQVFSLLVAVACCANVAMLLLIRVLVRQHTYAVKAALGARRVAIAQGPLFEALFLTTLGFALGAVMSSVASSVLRGLVMPPGPSAVSSVNASSAYALAVFAAVFAVAAGAIPAAVAASSASPSRTGHGRQGGGRVHVRVLAGFGLIQATLCGYLLVLFTLFGLSARNVLRIRTGLDVRDVAALFLTARTDQRGLVVDQPALQRVVASVRDAPGVVAAAMTVTVPFGTAQGVSVDVPGHLHLPSIAPFLNGVSPEYFGVVGTHLLRGRLFTATDDSAHAPVAIISQQTVRTIWGDSAAVDRCFYLGSDTRCVTVVGIVEDAKRLQLMEEPAMQIYIPLSQYRFQSGSRAVLAKVRGPMERVLSDLELRLGSLPATVSLDRIARLEDMLYPQIRPWTFGAKLLMLMSGVAVWLAMLGLFSMLSFSVTSRRRELAIRVALGATTRNIVRSTAVMPLALTCAAGVVGITGGVFTGRQVADFLYHTSWANPGAIAFAMATLLAIAIVGVSQPVWQALRLDPTITMREE